MNDYYTHVALAALSSVPMMIGIIVALSSIKNAPAHPKSSNDRGINILILRLILIGVYSILSGFMVITFTQPVPSEGWVREIYAVVLLSFFAPLIYLIVIALSNSLKRARVISILLLLFLISVPIGLHLEHPMNYFAFFSPLYWVSWAWIVESQLYSLMYGGISVFLTVFYSCLLYRRLKISRAR